MVVGGFVTDMVISVVPGLLVFVGEAVVVVFLVVDVDVGQAGGVGEFCGEQVL